MLSKFITGSSISGKLQKICFITKIHNTGCSKTSSQGDIYFLQMMRFLNIHPNFNNFIWSPFHLKVVSKRPLIESFAEFRRIYYISLFSKISFSITVPFVYMYSKIMCLCLFRQLIKSFSVSAGIDNTLLIFSHDVWDENINYLIRFFFKIVCCKVSLP